MVGFHQEGAMQRCDVTVADKYLRVLLDDGEIDIGENVRCAGSSPTTDDCPYRPVLKGPVYILRAFFGVTGKEKVFIMNIFAGSNIKTHTLNGQFPPLVICLGQCG